LPDIDNYVLCVLICFSVTMDGSDSCQNMFMDLDCMSCSNCISMQQVIVTIILYLQQYV